MGSTRKAYWVWLFLGVAVFAHSALAADGGIPGWLLYLQLKWFGAVFLTTTVLLGVALIGIPAVFLWNDRPNRNRAPYDRQKLAPLFAKRCLVAAALFAAAAGVAYWRTLLLPAPRGSARRLSLDELPAGAAVEEQRYLLTGTLQRAYRVGYEEALTGRMASVSSRHNFIPVTRSDWTPAAPVRFLVDAPRPASGDGSALLLRGHVPSFVRMALEEQGIHIASDVMVLSADPDFGRMPWDVAAGLLGIGSFVCLVFAGGWWIVAERTELQMASLGARAPAYLLFIIGILPAVLGLVLCGFKAVHIAAATKADGTVEGVQDSGSPLGKYSFDVAYTTPQGRFHQQASTDTPFSKSQGDGVTVLYQPDDPHHPEILVFDTDWFACMLLLAVGAAFIVPGIVVLNRIKRKTAGAREAVARAREGGAG